MQGHDRSTLNYKRFMPSAFRRMLFESFFVSQLHFSAYLKMCFVILLRSHVFFYCLIGQSQTNKPHNTVFLQLELFLFFFNCHFLNFSIYSMSNFKLSLYVNVNSERMQRWNQTLTSLRCSAILSIPNNVPA